MKNEDNVRIKKIAFSAVGITFPFAIFLNTLFVSGILMVGAMMVMVFFLLRTVMLPLRKKKIASSIVVLISVTIAMVSICFNYIEMVLALSPSLEMVIIAIMIITGGTIAVEAAALFVMVEIMRPFP